MGTADARAQHCNTGRYLTSLSNTQDSQQVAQGEGNQAIKGPPYLVMGSRYVAEPCRQSARPLYTYRVIQHATHSLVGTTPSEGDGMQIDLEWQMAYRIGRGVV